MKIARTLIAAASLAVLAAAPAAAQHHGGGGSHGGGGGGGYRGGGYHGGGYGHAYRGGYGWGGGYGYYGYGDAFALGLLGGYAIGAGPWGYNSYYDVPTPPPSYGVYDRAQPADFVDRADVRGQQAPLDDGRHCPLLWDKATNRYEPHCQ